MNNPLILDGNLADGGLAHFLKAADAACLYGQVDVVGERSGSVIVASGRLVVPADLGSGDEARSSLMDHLLALLGNDHGSYHCRPLTGTPSVDEMDSIPAAKAVMEAMIRRVAGGGAVGPPGLTPPPAAPPAAPARPAASINHRLAEDVVRPAASIDHRLAEDAVRPADSTTPDRAVVVPATRAPDRAADFDGVRAEVAAVARQQRAARLRQSMRQASSSPADPSSPVSAGPGSSPPAPSTAPSAHGSAPVPSPGATPPTVEPAAGDPDGDGPPPPPPRPDGGNGRPTSRRRALRNLIRTLTS